MTLNERVTLVRKYKHMNQKDFSFLVGILRSSLSEIEGGKRGANLDLITGISKNIPEISIDWLLNDKGEMLKQMVVREVKESYHVDSGIKGSKVLELFNDLNEVQQREIFFAIEEKKQFNELKSKVDFLTSYFVDDQNQQMTV